MSDRIENEIRDVFGDEVDAAIDTPLVVIEGTKGDPGADGVTPHIGDNGNWYVGSTDTGKPSRGATGAPGKDGTDGKPGAAGATGPAGVPGKDGHSPVVTATKSGKTTTISVDGAAIATVEDGADGKRGAAGADGITPHIGDNGHWYLGTTDTGKPSRGVTGAKGDAGATGPAGPVGPAGPAGAPGKTPVRGTDYWTVADKQEIVNSVIAALPDGTEVSY